MALGLHGSLPHGAAIFHVPGTGGHCESGVPGTCLNLTVFLSFLQLEVLTNLANETNISTILREFQVC